MVNKMQRDPRPLEEKLRDLRLIQDALGRAVRDALQLHRRAGNPIAVLQDGKVVWLPPEEIPTPEELGGPE